MCFSKYDLLPKITMVSIFISRFPPVHSAPGVKSFIHISLGTKSAPSRQPSCLSLYHSLYSSDPHVLRVGNGFKFLNEDFTKLTINLGNTYI